MKWQGVFLSYPQNGTLVQHIHVDTHQHLICWYPLKPWPNDRNMATQHSWAQHVATCYDMLAQTWERTDFSFNICGCCMIMLFGQVCVTMLRLGMRVKVWFLTINMLQQGGQMHATCYAQQCCDMLHWNVAIIWPELANAGPTMLGYVVLKCCDCVAGTLYMVLPKNTMQWSQPELGLKLRSLSWSKVHGHLLSGLKSGVCSMKPLGVCSWPLDEMTETSTLFKNWFEFTWMNHENNSFN